MVNPGCFLALFPASRRFRLSTTPSVRVVSAASTRGAAPEVEARTSRGGRVSVGRSAGRTGEKTARIDHVLRATRRRKSTRVRRRVRSPRTTTNSAARTAVDTARPMVRKRKTRVRRSPFDRVGRACRMRLFDVTQTNQLCQADYESQHPFWQSGRFRFRGLKPSFTSYFAAHSATCYLDRAFTSHSSRISPSMPSFLPMPAPPCDIVGPSPRSRETHEKLSSPSSFRLRRLRSPSPLKSFRKTTTTSLFRSPFRRRLGLARRPVLQEPGPSRRRRRRRRR